jgi:ssDNA-binding Zn-finger/Zn-ribbon topoisomerase 1
VLWQLSVVMSTFSEEEKERFWAGKGCPDCRFQWSSY